METFTYKGKTITYDPAKQYAILEEKGDTIGLTYINIQKFLTGLATSPKGEELVSIVHELCKENYQFFLKHMGGTAGEESFTMPLASETEMRQAAQELQNTCKVLEQLLE